MKAFDKLKALASLTLSLLLFSCISALGGCARTPTPVAERIVTVSVPVTVPCLSGKRPDAVPPLSVTIPKAEWDGLSPKQKAEAVAAQALRHQNRSDALEAATGACQ
jgi:hypothetical protein